MTKILIIDDEVSLTQLIKQALERSDFEIFIANDGADGLKKIDELNPDIVITDLRMPKVSGMDILKRTKKEHPLIEIIIITGHGGVDSAIEAMREGAFGYVEKPFVEFSVLELEIEKAIKRRSLILENKELEEKNKSSYILQQLVQEILRVNIGNSDLTVKLKVILEILQNAPFLLKTRQAAIFVVEDDPELLMMKSALNYPEEIMNRCDIIKFDNCSTSEVFKCLSGDTSSGHTLSEHTLSQGQCLCGSAAKTNTPLYVECDCLCSNEVFSTGKHIHYIIPISTSSYTYGVLALIIESGYKINSIEEDFIKTVVSILTGILEHILAEKKLLSAKNIAEKSNKLKSDILSTVAHELRTPLTSILAFCGTIKMSLTDMIFPILAEHPDEEVTEEINEIRNDLKIMEIEGDRLTNLLNDFLDLTKLESGVLNWKEEDVNFVEIINIVISNMRELLNKKNLSLESQIEDASFNILGEKGRFIQLITNLVGNAIKFTEIGGITIRLNIAGNNLRCEVEDTGHGIPPDMLSKIFEKFQQVGDVLVDKPKGTGLGLPICKEIVTHYKGKIWAESDGQNGSKFSFTIPMK
ncbi:MAG: response regulator [Nitrospirae bacterium]|nr:response regulator [Nitrospirota bacterium]MBF0541216.1 response regulator [Nitrospirota bacterium]